jgi:hypothetical protein
MGKSNRRCFPEPTRRRLEVANVNDAAEEGPSRQNGRSASERPAISATNAAQLSCSVNVNVINRALQNYQILIF